MLYATEKHQLITDLDEARYTLSHKVDKTPNETTVLDMIAELIKHVRDLPVGGE